MGNQRFRHKNHKKEGTPYIPPFDANVLGQPVETLPLSDELKGKLAKGNVTSLLDVVKRTERDFFRIPTFNKKNLIELKRFVESRSLYLRPLPEPKTAEQNGEAPKKQDEKQNASGREGNQRQQRREDRQNGTRNREEREPNQQRNGNRNDKNQPRGDKNAQPRDDKNRQRKGEKPQSKARIWPPDGISEQATKAEREKKRPKRPQVQSVSDIYLKLNKNGKWGFTDRQGKETVPPIYDEVFAYKEDLCCFEKDGLFGFIDRQGEEVIPAVYECAASFSEGLACVFKNGNCGYINKQNEVVVDFKFDAGTAVIDGNCRVKRDGKWGELWTERPLEIRWIN